MKFSDGGASSARLSQRVHERVPAKCNERLRTAREGFGERVGASKNLLRERRHGPQDISVIQPIYGMPVQKGISHSFGEKRQLETRSSSPSRATEASPEHSSRVVYAIEIVPLESAPTRRAARDASAAPRGPASRRSEPAAYTNRSADAQCARPASGTRACVYNTLDQRALAGWMQHDGKGSFRQGLALSLSQRALHTTSAERARRYHRTSRRGNSTRTSHYHHLTRTRYYVRVPTSDHRQFTGKKNRTRSAIASKDHSRIYRKALPLQGPYEAAAVLRINEHKFRTTA